MNFDTNFQPYKSERYCCTAKNAMVATSCSIASSAGLEIIKKGGNAIDAAVAAAAVLTVVEPTSNGIGGDAFAIVYKDNKLHGLNASGPAPKNISINKLHKLGINKEIPRHGWIPVTVPGIPAAWASLVEKFGKLSLIEDLTPAINYAQNGFSLSPVIAVLWKKYVNQNKNAYQDKTEHKEWLKMFTKNSEPYGFGEIIKFKDLAKTLRLIGESNAKDFYQGKIAKQFIKQSMRDGGFFTAADLANYQVEWVDPISINYRGYDIWELPPNGQGAIALGALNILKEFEFTCKNSFYTYYRQIEAIRRAFDLGFKTISDPKYINSDWQELLSCDFARNNALDISNIYQMSKNKPNDSGTVYLCTADSEGNMVSYIQSNYGDFGSGIVLENYGVSLQNRGVDFSLNPNDTNALQGGRRTYHTIIPGFITKDSIPVGPFGVMGGFMQPQGHVQLLMNLIDFHLNPQQAIDAPRWQWKNDNTIIVEPGFDEQIVKKLIDVGYIVNYATNRLSFGRGQIIIRLKNKALIGGTESRTDSDLACW